MNEEKNEKTHVKNKPCTGTFIWMRALILINNQ